MPTLHNPTTFTALLNTGRVLVADGGMGTSLFAAGLTSGESPEIWNVEHPERVADTHRGFVEAGADIILTNTFGGTRSRLALHGHQDRVFELNAAGVKVAAEVAQSVARPVAVAGSIGPTGELFEPYGTMGHEEGVAVFAEQADALVAGGVDVLWIETMSMSEELRAAVEAAARFDLPIVTTMSFDTNGHTMMGIGPTDLAGLWRDLDPQPVAVGVNCGIGPGDNLAVTSALREAAPEAAAVVKGNCGLPAYVEGHLDYPIGPETMADYAELAYRLGARIVGACCGSTPDHIATIRRTVDALDEPGAAPTFDEINERLGVNFSPAPAEPRVRHRRRWSGGR